MSDSSANEGRTMHELEQEYKEALEQVAMKKLEQEFFEEMEQNQGHIDLLEKNNVSSQRAADSELGKAVLREHHPNGQEQNQQRDLFEVRARKRRK